MKTVAIFILCGFIISCTNKSGQKEISQTPADTVTRTDDSLRTVVIDTTIILFPHLLTKAEITDNNTNVASSFTGVKTTSDMHWGFLTGENEGAVKIYFNRHINQKCREKTNDVTMDGTRISKGKAYVSLASSTFELTYDKAEFYREDSQGKLHKIPQDESIDKESVALVVEKGKATEIGVDFPENCPAGDYLLKIKLHNEQQERYEVYQWFEAYTSQRVSRRKRPIELDPLSLSYKTLSIEGDEVYEVVQNMPEFPGGGMPRLMEFIENNLQYDKEREGNGGKKRVIVQVIIDTDGTVTHPKILRGVSPALDKEALRVVKMMPKWKPGSQHGLPVKVKFTFPVTFEINHR